MPEKNEPRAIPPKEMREPVSFDSIKKNNPELSDSQVVELLLENLYFANEETKSRIRSNWTNWLKTMNEKEGSKKE